MTKSQTIMNNQDQNLKQSALFFGIWSLVIPMNKSVFGICLEFVI